MWNQATPKRQHPYLTRKEIRVTEHLRVTKSGTLLVPVLNAAGEIRSLQTIQADGKKRFLPGGEIKGCGYQIGAGPILVFAEGVATALSIHQATQLPVVIAFNANNLKYVALALRTCSKSRFVFAADNDKRGVGQNAAMAAADLTDGEVVVLSLIHI